VGTVLGHWSAGRADAGVYAGTALRALASHRDHQRGLLAFFDMLCSIVVVDDYAVTEGNGRTNYGFAFSVLSDDEQHETPYDTFNFRSKITHETAYFFWVGLCLTDRRRRGCRSRCRGAP